MANARDQIAATSRLLWRFSRTRRSDAPSENCDRCRRDGDPRLASSPISIRSEWIAEFPGNSGASAPIADDFDGAECEQRGESQDALVAVVGVPVHAVPAWATYRGRAQEPWHGLVYPRLGDRCSRTHRQCRARSEFLGGVCTIRGRHAVAVARETSKQARARERIPTLVP